VDTRFIAQSAEWAEIKALLLKAVSKSEDELLHFNDSFDHDHIAYLHAKARAAIEIYESVVREIELPVVPDEPEVAARPKDVRDFILRQTQGA
jgi:hypothetical protein